MHRRTFAAPLLLAALVSCAKNDAPVPQNAAAADPAPTAAPAAAVAAAPADPGTPAGPTPVVAADPAPSAAPTATAAGEGHDFAAQATLLFRVAACGDDSPLPARFSARDVASHCRHMQHRYASYHQHWLDRALPFFAAIRPPDLPTRVVYPFGGGDLITALTVFPDAQEITTISLEAAGDPRPIDTLDRRELRANLDAVGGFIERLLRAAHSTTKSLQLASHAELPGTLIFALAGLAVHGYEPVSLRYFTIRPDGSLHYLDLAELEEGARHFRELKKQRDGEEKVLRKKKLQVWKEQVAVFANVEIRFRARGAGQGAPIRVYRHIVANLDDTHLAETPGLITHLAAKGDVAAMTKAASYLLWMPDFSTIRNYLLGHMVWMASDSSGIPPQFAKAAGFQQQAYGNYAGPYFYYHGRTTKQEMAQFADLWAHKEKKRLPFRFGYPDVTRKGNHLLITRRVAH